MDYFSMTNTAEIHEFNKKVKYRNFYLSNFFKFGDLLVGWNLATNAKFQLSNSNIMPARPKITTLDMGSEYHYNKMLSSGPK